MAFVLCLGFSVSSAPSLFNVKWDTAISEPQHNTAGHDIVGGGMPTGNGDTALLVFPLANASAPSAGCTAKLLGAFCEIPNGIACHDSSCMLQLKPNITFSNDGVVAAKQAAGVCAAEPECVAFNVGSDGITKPGQPRWVQFTKWTSVFGKPAADSDWEYYYNASAATTTCPGGGNPRVPNFCEVENAIACHDESCQMDLRPMVVFSNNATVAQQQARGICAKLPGCVGFNIGNDDITKAGQPRAVQFVKRTGDFGHPFPDTDWDYFYNETVPVQPRSSKGVDLNAAAGSVSFFVNKADAMASDTSLFKLGLVSLIITPNPFEGTSDFVQELDLSTASVKISSGGVAVDVRVDAHSNTVLAEVTSQTPVTIQVLLQSVHPSKRFGYGGGFGFAEPQSDPDVFDSSSSHQLPAPVTDAGQLVIYHANKDTDVPAAFNDTLEQQGLGHLAPELQASDRWRNRVFGMAISGVSGSGGTAFAKVNSTVLQTVTATKQARVVVSTHSEQASVQDWRWELDRQHSQQLAVLSTADGVRQNFQKHADWWGGFWNRSWIQVNASNEGSDGFHLSQQYAITRFVQAVQSRDQGGNGWVPIKVYGLHGEHFGVFNLTTSLVQSTFHPVQWYDVHEQHRRRNGDERAQLQGLGRK
jgi:hypothetical protein